MTSGVVVLLVAASVALAVGAWRLGVDGRFRSTAPAAPTPAAEAVRAAGGVLGERATLLQFSSAFCAPCRATRRVLQDVAARVDGVAHVELDAEHHLDDTRALGVLRTPTTLVLDAEGREVSRAAGVPKADQVLAALGRAVP